MPAFTHSPALVVNRRVGTFKQTRFMAFLFFFLVFFFCKLFNTFLKILSKDIERLDRRLNQSSIFRFFPRADDSENQRNV